MCIPLRTLLLIFALLAGLLCSATAQEPRDFSSVRMNEDGRLRRFVVFGRDNITDEGWDEAVKVLQMALDENRDYYIQVSERDPGRPKREIMRWVSARYESHRLIGSMPAKGLQVYEAKYGPTAQKALDDAKKKDDRELLMQVVARFRHTKAGGEAVRLLTKDGAFELPKLDGSPTWRAEATKTSPPLLDKKLWSRPLCKDKLDGFDDMDPDDSALARLEDAIKQVRDLKQPVLPGSFPIVSQGVMVYRTQRDVRAVAVKDIPIKDEENGKVITTVKPRQILWKAIPHSRSLGSLLDKASYRDRVNIWFEVYDKVPGFGSFVYENTLLGTLAADQRYVYAINDMGAPPHPSVFALGKFNPNPFTKPGDLRPLLMQNELYAYDLVTGKLKWDLNHDDPPFRNSHFLGMPISIGGRLYVLNEKLVNDAKPGAPLGPELSAGESELRLVCIDPNKTTTVDSSIKPTIERIIVLANVVQSGRIVQDIRRRTHACPLAYADGILVCTTNAGEVFGIDLPTRSLAWSYAYRESFQEPIVLPGMDAPKGMAGTTVLAKWKAAPPAIHRGKVVFTAPDADSIHCVDLNTGKPIWKKSRQQGDLFLAGVNAGRALIVGDKTIRTLDLQDGSQSWSIDLGDLPAGQGAFSDGIYYLPLTKEVLAVDAVKGIVKARYRLPAGANSPGNLVFYEDKVLFQTPTEVVAYPQMIAK